MEEEIDFLLTTTSLTDIILIYDELEDRLDKLEKKIININNVNVNGDGDKNVNGDKDKLSKLKLLLDNTTDVKIKKSTIEELLTMYKNIKKFMT